jgi:hypothetical protein
MTFEIGEIALLNCRKTAWNGREVEVVSGLVLTGRYMFETGVKLPPEPCYMVRADWLPVPTEWAYPPSDLRKRPQPPDWEALAKPDAAPAQANAGVGSAEHK